MKVITDYQICTRCIMDTTDPDIRFDENGVCEYCLKHEPLLKKIQPSREEGYRRLQRVVDKIKVYGQGREYDCLLGVSGGVDSSYVAYLAGIHGLRPLVVHFDNGWNSELSVENIRRIIDKFNFDLLTYVIDWEEFKDLQRSFFKASVVDIELLTDHAIAAAMYIIAQQQKIKYILVGGNLATENGMPNAWVWHKKDLGNIKAIQRRFGTLPIKSFPTFSVWRWLWIRAWSSLVYVRFLDLIHYRKYEAIETLSRELGWRYYGGKHYESVFTKFYQAYVLPEKFGIDKRKVHFSSLIRNGEMTREQAMSELQRPLYDPEKLEQDKSYVLKKLEFSEEDFEAIMKQPVKSHLDYWSDWHILRHPIALSNRFFRHR